MKNEDTYIKRKKTRRIYVGKVPVGNGAPISVQSMTNTRTTDIKSTIQQINFLKKSGADIVRISLPTVEDAVAFKEIKKSVDIPLVADIHFDYRIAIKAAEYGADCLRINPGNIGNEKRIRSVIDCAKYNNIPIRIGVNSGSLEKKILNKYNGITPNALLESVLNNIRILEKYNFDNYKISIKSSDVSITIRSNELLSNYTRQPLHIGITESGTIRNGIIKSSIGIGFLLYKGIGDTLRVSLSADPTKEIFVGYKILQALNLKKKGINFISCPTCSRQEFNVIKTVNLLEKKLEDIEIPMDVSIIGCIVNGLGEALSSTIGIIGHRNSSSIYEDGVRRNIRIDNEEMVDQLEKYIRKKAEKIKKNKNLL